MNIVFTKANRERPKPDFKNLGFGKYFAEYMFEMDYSKNGWENPQIKPYDKICIEPSTMVFHYGQSVFEGLKAYFSDNDEILLFRPEKNIKRLNKSSERLCIPALDEKFALKAIVELVKANKDWIPKETGSSLYIRPFIFAMDASVGVRSAERYKFMIIASPVGAYYPEGFNPVKIFVEQKYVRAVRGGIGEAKTAGNYAASIKAQTEAKKKGCAQVLWLDGVEQKYIEEVGTMNVFFKINDEILTPELNGSILDGITRDSIIQLLRKNGLKVTEKRISIDEIFKALLNGQLEEVFGTGTAAIISPVGEISFNGTDFKINEGKVGGVSLQLFDTLTGIQQGKINDEFGWTLKV
ncbi:branched-chain amino acid aminotransferase [Maribellus maritimus]|uniref:branched-chain amino acid aminotransferase n=1 Tax=Maribellus maritimus TaxID=2870838 RepID=UPI001EEBF3B0|nr:branched-chain amino acid aminotransferase [Maribellus maritimus]MCG6187671.1 branched-chain amino acid aminotransferase [Maribellus maritimus]